MSQDLPELPSHAFAKADPDDDELFYGPARLVTHIDGDATAALARFYASRLRKDDAVLDLMSSWISHLPADLDLREVVGHGMNGEELAANPRLDSWFVQNLNNVSTLPLGSGRFDAVLCCVGVQYLQQPVAVFREARRVLRRDGLIAVSFSNRCFPTKAVAVWQALDVNGQAVLVRLYLERAGFGDVEAIVLRDGREGDPLVCVLGRG
ncbi:methyltransferase type 11 [Aureimonas sp. Leaf454]|uniref:class I SAM-dependent methyltransferase n=1 Tax=Aureimonas sp. Leaf454 TaxID=1736381 RepID=UPI0006FBE837|nr:methyltransferase domain-containing protein [Aureimonas sp. Leaf454]KQT44554.1 methyltransferase type 11 [Aureimonas sp. Leaf454]